MIGRRGFTLVETVLALAITAVVLAAVGGVVGRVAQGGAAVDRRVDALAGGRLLLGLLADEIEGSVPGSLAVVAADDASGIRLDLTTSTADGVPVAVTYRLDGDRLLRGARSPFATAEPAAEAILNGVAALAVDCFDGSTWSPRCHGQRPPEAVALRLRLEGGETLRTTVIPAVRRRA
jgi:prepilin-type N-terminal cleavage/methylation domain-containing protein